MVVLDNISNGYRDLILPMACEDEVLRRAIGVVAAQHLGQKRPDLQNVAETGRSAVISRLRRDALQAPPERVFNMYTWATLIVLLVGETVTGSGEYGYLLQMLLCLSRSRSNQPKDGASSVENFLVQQTHMFEFLSKPLLGTSEEETDAFSTTSPTPTSPSLDRYLDWLTYTSLPPDSAHAALISITRQAFLQAFRLNTSHDLHSPLLLVHLQHLVQQIDPDAPVAHALVWVCFLGAAAPGADAAQRAFFTARMSAVHAKTGFGNIPAAIRSLEEIWARRDRASDERRGGYLVGSSPVLVM